ncbi:MAG: hypothetical protein MR270_07045 [Erysipelotrichaceae bacterium]|nr:hypothetical protein [Erysipelotrichaceae bacterium]
MLFVLCVIVIVVIVAAVAEFVEEIEFDNQTETNDYYGGINADLNVNDFAKFMFGVSTLAGAISILSFDANIKKQGRELLNKTRNKPDWVNRSGRRRPPKKRKHTHGIDHNHHKSKKISKILISGIISEIVELFVEDL